MADLCIVMCPFMTLSYNELKYACLSVYLIFVIY